MRCSQEERCRGASIKEKASFMVELLRQGKCRGMLGQGGQLRGCNTGVEPCLDVCVVSLQPRLFSQGCAAKGGPHGLGGERSTPKANPG